MQRPDLSLRNKAIRGGITPYEDREWLRSRYQDQGLTLREIAAEGQCSLRTIARWMQIHAIPTAPSIDQRRRRGSIVTGERHSAWRGGPPTCCICGHAISRGSTTCRSCRDRSGDRNSRWLGNDAGYEQAHWRVKSLRGPATGHACVSCGSVAAHWAYDHADPEEKRDPDEGYYSLDVQRYRPMCVRCHKRFDMKQQVIRRANSSAP